MNRRLSIAAAVAAVFALAALRAAEGQLETNVTVRLAERGEGARILGTEDAFIRALGPFDRMARMESTEDAPETEFLKYLADQARDFTGAEAAKMLRAVDGVRSKLSAAGLRLNFPSVITIVKTTGLDEDHAAYCRGAAMMMPQNFIDLPPVALERIFTHELFHILTNANPSYREPLYAIVGFRPCAPVTLPAPVFRRKITNPDAFRNDFLMEARRGDEDVLVMPITLSSREAYNPALGRGLFGYLTLKLLVVEEQGGKCVPAVTNGRVRLLPPAAVPTYVDRLGGNTAYIFHPEEALAENFTFLVQGGRVSDSETVAKMKEFFQRQSDAPAVTLQSSAPQ